MVRQAFCPQFERIDNAVTIRDILVFHEDHVAGLKEEFTGGDLSFALSCEIWGTSYHRMSYLCVAAHYVDGDHILNKRVIGFKLIDGAPTAEAMARRILDVAMEYGIENRIVSVTLGDGLADAETMDALAPLLGWYTGGFVFLQRCIFSILNDIVRAGLAEMAGPLDAIRSATAYVSSLEANFAEFEKCCVERGQKARKLWPDSKLNEDIVMGFSYLRTACSNFRGSPSIIEVNLVPTKSEQFITLKAIDFHGNPSGSITGGR
ncbi:hypothetical protein OsI_18975 [Oryza sativa Indica Group]|uniref:Uncharacterized protein n=1 Tax=Oryza sativa subsp. indica TaxID=39946 RepID=B8AZE8_ORYSI|nr:hypothetical protein OsI_18975 [Oryza sativa Indica Group]